MRELVVRVGTRSSDLALWQANHVIERLEGATQGLRCERVPIRTLGDRVKDVPLPRFGDRGLFTREIESALRAGTIDVAVHSLKDLPTEEPEGLDRRRRARTRGCARRTGVGHWRNARLTAGGSQGGHLVDAPPGTDTRSPS